ncbi:hypothetical protein AB0J80_03660 [Actinoplanes sp. NPDC049548]|uniref:hypothetical protein n=1 Tax=Actinoplanes sp. NPDC049548 TaxID=3155152 RepID=UPI0034245911
MKGRWVPGVVAALVAAGCATPGTRDGDSSPKPSASASVAPPVEREGPVGDAAPNNADNNGWKRRHELTYDEQQAGERLAGRIRPRLATLRKAGDFAPGSTRQALLDLGIDEDAVQVAAMTAAPGVVYAVSFPEAGCVVGDVRPERLMVEVTGAAAEFGCLEPTSH